MLFLFPPPPHLCAHLERHLLIGPRRPLLVHGAAQAVDLEAATQRRSTPGRPWAEAKVEGHRPTSRHMEAWPRCILPRADPHSASAILLSDTLFCYQFC